MLISDEDYGGSKLKPGLTSLGTRIADIRNGLELLEAKMQEEANLKVGATELERQSKSLQS
jgi:hypothetical protein